MDVGTDQSPPLPYWEKVGLLLGCWNFWDWPDAGLFPLLWYCWWCYWEVKEHSNLSGEDWSSQSKKPGWESIQTSSCCVKVVEHLKYFLFWDVFRPHRSSQLLAPWSDIGVVSGLEIIIIIIRRLITRAMSDIWLNLRWDVRSWFIRQNRWVLSRCLKVCTVGAVLMAAGISFQIFGAQ